MVVTRPPFSRSLADATADAHHLARMIREEGHAVATARLFTPKRQAALVLIEGGKAEARRGGAGIPSIVRSPGGRITIWTDKAKREHSGQVPIVFPCCYCEGLHVRRLDGNYSCSRGRFVQEIVKQFPSLCSAPVVPWSAAKFYRWAKTSPAITSGSHHAAAFVLSVWDPDGPWSKGHLHFSVVKAFQHWDDAHRSAFRTWAERPWWP